MEQRNGDNTAVNTRGSVTYSYISITKFSECRRDNWRFTKSIDGLVNAMQDEITSTFEILRQPVRRIYLDVENIPEDQPKMIQSIIKEFAEFIGVSPVDHALTINNNSHHPGLSYHVYFPYKLPAKTILDRIKEFKQSVNGKYDEYIDELVYDRNRLFRLPNQLAVADNGDTDYDPSKDFHVIVKGELADVIIQNVNNIPDLSRLKSNQYRTTEWRDTIQNVKESLTTYKHNIFSGPDLSEHFTTGDANGDANGDATGNATSVPIVNNPTEEVIKRSSREQQLEDIVMRMALQNINKNETKNNTSTIFGMVVIVILLVAVILK